MAKVKFVNARLYPENAYEKDAISVKIKTRNGEVPLLVRYEDRIFYRSDEDWRTSPYCFFEISYIPMVSKE